MTSWHDESGCSRFDLFQSDGLATCLSCGALCDTPSVEAVQPSPVEVTQTYVYQPIKHRAEMRLFLLGPGEMDDPIRGDLATISVSDQDEYDAISYTWADESDDATKCFHALIGTTSIPITRNCQAALRKVRSPYYVKSVWIDSICIDQDNVQERGHQVDLMPRIYTRARKTFVYVGESADGSHALLDTLKLGRVQYERRPYELRIWTECFLNRPYFSRIWVIQEIALSRNKIILCGDNEIPWSVFEAGVKSVFEVTGNTFKDRVKSPLKDGGNLPPLLSLGQRRLRDAAELFGLLQLGRRCKATDPRDKVFALLGLVVGAEAEGLVADYEKSTEEVYAWISQYLHRRQKCSTVDILGNVNLMDWNAWSPDCPQAALPSWFPDWNSTGPTLMRKYDHAKPYLAGIPLQFDDSNGRALCLQGYFFGNLKRLPRQSPTSSLRATVDWLVHNNNRELHYPAFQSGCKCSVCSALGHRALVFQVMTHTFTHPGGIISSSDILSSEPFAGHPRVFMLLYPVDSDNVEDTEPQPQSRKEGFRIWWVDEDKARESGTLFLESDLYADFEPPGAKTFKLVGLLRYSPSFGLCRTQLGNSPDMTASIRLV